MRTKYILASSNEAVLGWQYGDGSQKPLLRLYNDKNGVSQIEYLTGTNEAYGFLPSCAELLDILKNGIVGVPIKGVSQQLVQAGYLPAAGERFRGKL